MHTIHFRTSVSKFTIEGGYIRQNKQLLFSTSCRVSMVVLASDIIAIPTVPMPQQHSIIRESRIVFLPKIVLIPVTSDLVSGMGLFAASGAYLGDSLFYRPRQGKTRQLNGYHFWRRYFFFFWFFLFILIPSHNTRSMSIYRIIVVNVDCRSWYSVQFNLESPANPLWILTPHSKLDLFRLQIGKYISVLVAELIYLQDPCQTRFEPWRGSDSRESFAQQ